MCRCFNFGKIAGILFSHNLTVAPFKFISIVLCVTPFKHFQDGYGTGKTGNLVITFSRQGKHREFRYSTGKIWTTWNFPNFPKNQVFYSKLPFHQLMYPYFFLALLCLTSFHQLPSCPCLSHTFMSGS